MEQRPAVIRGDDGVVRCRWADSAPEYRAYHDTECAGELEHLLGDPAIVRNRAKIEAVINNAGRAVELVSECGSLAAFAWGFEPTPRAGGLRREAIEAHTAESRALARELKRRGWRFVGPTTVYAFMQAMGLVNDHLEGCAAWAEVEAARARLTRPTTPA